MYITYIYISILLFLVMKCQSVYTYYLDILTSSKKAIYIFMGILQEGRCYYRIDSSLVEIRQCIYIAHLNTGAQLLQVGNL